MSGSAPSAARKANGKAKASRRKSRKGSGVFMSARRTVGRRRRESIQARELTFLPENAGQDHFLDFPEPRNRHRDRQQDNEDKHAIPSAVDEGHNRPRMPPQRGAF